MMKHPRERNVDQHGALLADGCYVKDVLVLEDKCMNESIKYRTLTEYSDSLQELNK